MAKVFHWRQNPNSRSDDRIICLYEENNNLIGITRGGSHTHQGGFGKIAQIINSSDHAIIINESGSKVIFDFKTRSTRAI